MKAASKLVKKEIRAVAKARKSAKIRRLLEEFEDLQRITGIRGGGKRMCMGAVIDKNGVEKTDNDDIAEVFAEFFESLYRGESS